MKKKLFITTLSVILLSSCSLVQKNLSSPSSSFFSSSNSSSLENSSTWSFSSSSALENEIVSSLKEEDIIYADNVISSFGTLTWYSQNETNPYNIDISAYGSNVKVAFYQVDEDYLDPYAEYDSSKTYYANNSFSIASSYEDAIYRTEHGIISGDIDEYDKTLYQTNHLPTLGKAKENTRIRLTNAYYILDTNGNYLAYLLPSLTSAPKIIYYGGGYISLDEEASYLLAFGEVPPSSYYTKNEKSTCLSLWWKYGRLNYSTFSANTSSYPFQPELSKLNGKSYSLSETDFGSLGKFSVNDLTQNIYNTGTGINRGTCRFVFTKASSSLSIDDRFVFYTYNHYNDFQEFLNYSSGWGDIFGNETAGNPYCSSGSDYDKNTFASPTPYPNTLKLSLDEIELS
jgi:hypothetical protein